MNIENLTKEELRMMIREVLAEGLEKKQIKKNVPNKHYSKQNSDLESLIGSIPFILLDKTIFEKNLDVVEFASKIGIIITSGEKKKLAEIVGRIIEAIKEFPPQKVVKLNQAISQLKSYPSKKKDKISFFKEWDNVITNMKL